MKFSISFLLYITLGLVSSSPIDSGTIDSDLKFNFVDTEASESPSGLSSTGVSLVQRQAIAITSDSPIAKQPPARPDFVEIEGSSGYFAISSRCTQAQHDAYVAAYTDSQIIANAATAWPQLGGDAMDTYMGPELANEPYSEEFINFTTSAFKKMSTFGGEPGWGFPTYINLECQDRYNACKNKILGDSRSIACYVNRTTSWWWDLDIINCCPPFFNTENITQVAKEQAQHPTNPPPGLGWLRTTGGLLIHEMMHTNTITGNNPVHDKPWKGLRMYGPPACADAAKSSQGGWLVTQQNADSYAQVAQAMYWKNIFQGQLPPPSSSLSGQTGDGDLPYMLDHQDNYPPECVMSPECGFPNGDAVNAACTCLCDGAVTPISDPRCMNFIGLLPDPTVSPANGP